MTASLNDSVSNLAGVGPATSERFESIGIKTVNDLIYHFPARYDNIEARDIKTILDNEKVTLKGRVITEPVVSYFGPRKSRLVFRLAVTDTDIIQVVFFNQPYLKGKIELGKTYAFYGTWQEGRQSLNARRMLQSQEEGADFSPIYSTTQGLTQSQIIKAIRQAFDSYGHLIEEIIPEYLNDKYQMLPLAQALYQMHFPQDKEEHFEAERKIIFQEFYLYQWRLQIARLKQKETPGVVVNYDVDELREVIKALPFELTDAQKRVVNEICYDLLAPYPMKRMLQGDVGSGKTMVAFIAMIASVIAGYQTALLVPTEILAKQHQQSFNKTFEKIGLHAELLVGKMKTKDKANLTDGLASGRIRLVIGTHALIQESVEFKQLGLVVIDEQHRFGVGQRQTLLDKGQGSRQTNLLQMTATPIPRSLALSMYGEFSVSTIDELPKGRQEITTRLAKPTELTAVYQSMREELEKGRQVYYVVPIIESSEHTGDLENVYETYERLMAEFSEYSLQVIHGQMPKDEQELVMESFQANEAQVLVATTVIEVGVDVPNATLMVIQSAERFGLAQLHQLRGRVGRGQHKSTCILIADPTTDQGKERMQIMLETQDGFKISEADMKLRGIGDVLGREQSGVPDFNYANLYEDRKVHEVARQEVIAGLNSQTLLTDEDLKRLNNWSHDVIIEI